MTILKRMKQNYFLQVIVLWALIFSYGLSQATTCPDPKEIGYFPDGSFKTVSGWYSEGSIKGLKHPLLTFDSVAYTNSNQGEKTLGPCVYNLNGNIVRMLWVENAPFFPMGKKWQQPPIPGAGVTCGPWVSVTDCPFLLGPEAKAKEAAQKSAENPFDVKTK